MRHVQHTLTPSVVHSHLHGQLLQHLRLNDYKRSVTAGQLADLLILLAATARPLTACVHARFAFCYEVARRAVSAILPRPAEIDDLTHVGVNLLRAITDFSRRDRRRPWLLAIDTHNDPYYGSRLTSHIRGGQRKQGTKYFHVTASVVLIHKRAATPSACCRSPLRLPSTASSNNSSSKSTRGALPSGASCSIQGSTVPTRCSSSNATA